MNHIPCAFEWTIKNFTCWNPNIHGASITSPKAHFPLQMTITPIGAGGNVKVKLASGRDFTVSSCDLSFIGCDGSYFCIRNVDVSDGRVKENRILGPKFEEVVDHTRKNEERHKDKFTLRCVMNCSFTRDVYVSTKIACFRSTLKIAGEKLDDFLSEAPFGSTIVYHSRHGDIASIDVSPFKERSNYSEILFKISSSDVVLILGTIAVISRDNATMRAREFQHMFNKTKECVIRFPLRRDEVVENDYSLLLRLRIVPPQKYSHKFGYSYVPCNVTMMPTYSSVVKSVHDTTDSASNKTTHPSDLTKDLMCLYQDKDFSDFQLKSEDVTFPVHKVILSARSPVFKTMLSTDMTEAASGQVVVDDLDPSTLSLFLAYLYTGAVEDLDWNRALKLYYAADKYLVPSLKGECVKFLCDSVSISTVCDILTLADRHRDDQLTSAAHDFVVKNYNEVLTSEEWVYLLKSDPVLVAKSLTQFAQKKQVGKTTGWQVL